MKGIVDLLPSVLFIFFRRKKMLSFKVLISIMVLTIQAVGGKPICDPEDNKYYHLQADKCFSCENCLQGEEAISLQVHNYFVLFKQYFCWN